jgi:ribosomal protein S18 acetylase RimI-like enzyme
MSVSVRPVAAGDEGWVREALRARWGDARVVSRGAVWDPVALPGFVAEADGSRVGLVTYRIGDGECEIVTLDALEERSGVGTALVEAVAGMARGAGAARVWLITTNDNLDALRFYQRRGFALVAVHPGALAESRRLKPSIPEVGAHGIPLRDELELERRLDGES